MQISHWLARCRYFAYERASYDISRAKQRQQQSDVTDQRNAVVHSAMSKFAALNRRYLRISKNTTLEVRIYLHPEFIPSFTDDLLKVSLSLNHFTRNWKFVYVYRNSSCLFNHLLSRN